MAVLNVTILMASPGDQVAVVKESAKEVLDIIEKANRPAPKLWFEFTTPLNKQHWLHNDVVRTIRIVAEGQADDGRPGNNILVPELRAVPTN